MNEEANKNEPVSSIKTTNKDSKNGNTLPRTVLLLLSCLTVGFMGGRFGSKSNTLQNLSTQSQEVRQQVVSSESQLISQIAKDVGASVVSINVTSASSQDIFGRSYESQGAGTGFIASEDGLIVTNSHVVPAGSSDITVTLSDGTELTDVEIVGRGKQNEDIAFLKIKDKKDKTLKPVKIGDSSKTQVGEKVVAIGNALGQFQNSVTSGIISGQGRPITAGGDSLSSAENLTNLLQTDTAINEGNSGGPLVNLSGEVIGINTAIAANAQNIGFAIPINDVTSLIAKVKDKGKLVRPYLGIRYLQLDDGYAYQYNLPVKRGAYLQPPSTRVSSSAPAVIKGSPADKAGLKEKDIITKINGTQIDEKNGVTALLGKYDPGDTIKLTVLRDGKELSIDVKLEESPSTNI